MCGLIVKLASKSSQSTTRALIEQLEGYKVETITYDNGLEFFGHLEVSRALNTPKATFVGPIIAGKRVVSKTTMAWYGNTFPKVLRSPICLMKALKK